MKAAGPLQKLLHLANAREALASGDLQQALMEAEAAVAADPTFVAAQTLRAEVMARMDEPVPAVKSETVAVAVPAPAAAAPLGSSESPLNPPVDLRHRVIPAARPRSQRTFMSGRRTGAAIALGLLVVIAGVGIALFATGIMARQPRHAFAAPPQRPLPVGAQSTPTPPAAKPATVATAASPPEKQHAEPQAPVDPAAVPERSGVEWASPRLARLSVRPRWRASAMHVEDAALLKDLGEGISELWVGKLTGNEDAIFIGGAMEQDDWVKLRSSLKPTGVIWRIYSSRLTAADAASATTAAAAGFARLKKVRYSTDYVAEQFALRGATR